MPFHLFNELMALQVRYAFELLTNPIWKRDYDLFGIDEQLVRPDFIFYN